MQQETKTGSSQPGILRRRGASIKKRVMVLAKKLDDATLHQMDIWLSGGEGKLKKGKTSQSNKQSHSSGIPLESGSAAWPGGLQQSSTTTSSTGATVKLPRLPARAPGELINNYLIFKAWNLTRSNYYRACRNKCPNGHPVSGEGSNRCDVCQAELPAFLLHEIYAQLSPDERRQPLKAIEHRFAQHFAHLKSGIPGALKPIEVFYLEQGNQVYQYLVAEYPAGSWTSLYKLKMPPADLNQIADWSLNLGQTLNHLGELMLAPGFPSVTELLEALIIVQDQLEYADLSYFMTPSEAGGAEIQKAHLTHMQVTHLGQVLYTIASGKFQNMSRAPLELGDVPLPFRRLVDRARRGEFISLDEFLRMLNAQQRAASQSPEFDRSLRQSTGYRTSPGRVRKNNEDFIGKYSLGLQQSAEMPEVGLYIVADGMGGHQAGELASSQVVREVLGQVQIKLQQLQSVPRLNRQTIKLDETITPGEALSAAIQQANEILYKARQQLGSDRGTTITAALVIGDLAAIANVGDSRTYIYHDGKLEQVTRDHSLVASLVAAKLIRPDEVRSHPQRNSILRSMGEQPTIEVDLFQRQLAAGDSLLLCSDGLWEMVLDSDIEKILRQTTSPQAACDRLIEAANLAGGDDNISVIVVRIE